MNHWQAFWIGVVCLWALATLAAAVLLWFILRNQRLQTRLKTQEVELIRHYLELSKGYAQAVVSTATVTRQVVAEKAEELKQKVDEVRGLAMTPFTTADDVRVTATGPAGDATRVADAERVVELAKETLEKKATPLTAVGGREG